MFGNCKDTVDVTQMLQYYESHLVFTQNDSNMNGDDDGNLSMKDAY